MVLYLFLVGIIHWACELIVARPLLIEEKRQDLMYKLGFILCLWRVYKSRESCIQFVDVAAFWDGQYCGTPAYNGLVSFVCDIYFQLFYQPISGVSLPSPFSFTLLPPPVHVSLLHFSKIEVQIVKQGEITEHLILKKCMGKNTYFILCMCLYEKTSDSLIANMKRYSWGL